MKIIHFQEISPQKVETEGARDVTIRWLITQNDGAPRFAMRLFELKPGGHSPLHTHDFEHEVFIIEGEGTVWKEGQETAIREGTAIFVAPGEKHQFKNTGKSRMRFLCMVPV